MTIVLVNRLKTLLYIYPDMYASDRDYGIVSFPDLRRVQEYQSIGAALPLDSLPAVAILLLTYTHNIWNARGRHRTHMASERNDKSDTTSLGPVAL